MKIDIAKIYCLKEIPLWLRALSVIGFLLFSIAFMMLLRGYNPLLWALVLTFGLMIFLLSRWRYIYYYNRYHEDHKEGEE